MVSPLWRAVLIGRKLPHPRQSTPFQGRLSSSDRPVWKCKGLNLSHPGLGQLCRVIPAPKLPTGLTEAFVSHTLKLDFFLR